MAKVRVHQIQQSVPDGADDLSLRFYIDRRTGDTPVPRVELHLTTVNGDEVTVDRPFSDITALTGSQKTNLRNMLIAIRDQVLGLEGFT